MWLATLVAPIERGASRAVVPVLLCWCALALGFGPSSAGIPPQWNAVWTTVQTVLAFVLLGGVLRQLRENHAADARPPVLAEALPA
jgi:hypothetical protein